MPQVASFVNVVLVVIVVVLLFPITLVVELLFHDLAREDLLADLDLHLGVEIGIGGIDEGHTDTLVGGESVIARGYFANRFTSHIQDGITVTGDGLVEEFDAHEFLGWPLGLLPGERLLADELCLVEFHEHTQSCHDGRDLFRQFIAIEWQSHLEAQRITTAESTSLDTSGNQLVPALTDIVVRGIDLKAVLTGIACSGDDELWSEE